jgi:hypothetical protein
MGQSSRSNRKKALGTERRRHLEVAQWEEKSAKARADALAKCVAAEPVPVPEPTAADADGMELDRGRHGAAEPQEQQQQQRQSKKKRKGRGVDGMDVEVQPQKKKLPGRGSLKGLNKRKGGRPSPHRAPAQVQAACPHAAPCLTPRRGCQAAWRCCRWLLPPAAAALPPAPRVRKTGSSMPATDDALTPALSGSYQITSTSRR